jgi:hypothetical protein
MYKSQPYYVKQNSSIPQKRITTMVYYLFPKYSLHFLNYLNISSDPQDHYVISPSLYHYIEEIECRILECKTWDSIYKNPYSLLNSYSKMTDVSFFYFEILELYSIMHFSWESFYRIQSIHLGLEADMSIKALKYIRKNNENENMYILENTNTLDYTNMFTNIDVAFCNSSSSSSEYINAINLLTQICFVLLSQKRKGACIIKYSDTFSALSLDIISFISFFYEKVYFLKPSVCDITNGDKYIVCKNFVFDSLTNRTIDTIKDLHNTIVNSKTKIYRILSCPIPLFISSKLEEINSIFGQPRLEYIHQLLGDYDKCEFKNNKQKSLDWCNKYLKWNNYFSNRPSF